MPYLLFLVVLVCTSYLTLHNSQNEPHTTGVGEFVEEVNYY